jgi:DNA-binding GntR family transcriptional regulator
MLPLKERVYRHIRDEMLSGRIKPGQSVSESVLAKDIGVSRTPVREALARLESLGLIEQSPGIGTRVREPGRREIEEFFELREILECGAVRLAADRITDEELAQLEALVEQYRILATRLRLPMSPEARLEDSNKMNILDMSFHLMLMSASKNRRMVQMVADVHLLTRILRRSAALPGESPIRRSARVLLHHGRILRALRNHLVEQAVQATCRHVQWSMREHLAAFDWYARAGGDRQGQDGIFPQSVLEVLGQMELEVARGKPQQQARRPRR